MQISSTSTNIQNSENIKGAKSLYTQKLTKDEVDGLRQQVVESTNAFTFKSVSLQAQTQTLSFEDKFKKEYEEFQSFLKDVGYNGKPIAELSEDEAKVLVADDGIFGVKQTSERIANFVINGANGDEKLLRAGREGMMQGFSEAQKVWGDEKLPDIAQKTMQAATEMIDKVMNDLGFSVLDATA